MQGKAWFSVLAFLVCGSPCLAQTTSAPVARNAVFFELLGNGGLYSFNYERMVTDSLALRLGYASWSSPLLFEGTPPDRYTTVPVTVSYLLGRSWSSAAASRSSVGRLTVSPTFAGMFPLKV
jgi:hypothetical protein